MCLIHKAYPIQVTIFQMENAWGLVQFGKFGGLLPAVEDLHQNILCFAAKVATWTLFVMHAQ